MFSDGETFQFKRSGLWQPEWSMVDSRGMGMLLLRRDSGWKKNKADVEIWGASIPSKRALLLAILGWYVMIQIPDYDYDGGASMAAAMAASGV